MRHRPGRCNAEPTSRVTGTQSFTITLHVGRCCRNLSTAAELTDVPCTYIESLDSAIGRDIRAICRYRSYLLLVGQYLSFCVSDQDESRRDEAMAANYYQTRYGTRSRAVSVYQPSPMAADHPRSTNRADRALFVLKTASLGRLAARSVPVFVQDMYSRLAECRASPLQRSRVVPAKLRCE